MAETVSRQTDPDRFEISVDEGVAGFARFVDHAGRRVFFHTEIDDAFSGRGLAGVVVREALDATVAEGLTIVAVCPYVQRYVSQHDDWSGHVSPARPDDFVAIQG